MIEAVIFDWAGTTVDYGCFAPVNAFYEAFKSIGIEVTPQQIRKPMGLLKKDHIKAMLNDAQIGKAFEQRYGRLVGEHDIEILYQLFEKILLSQLAEHATPIPGVVKLTKWLRSEGIKIGSTTGYTSEMMAIIAPIAAQQGYAPDCIITPDMVGSGRPSPKMMEENISRLGIKNRQKVLKIGDTIADIEEGNNAGVRSVGVLFGSSLLGSKEGKTVREAELASVKQCYFTAGADHVISEIGAVRELIQLLNRIG
ncbi:MAG: phosphonoacetaldehyde hydrolase [Culicoidibacterales bacterium]